MMVELVDTSGLSPDDHSGHAGSSPAHATRAPWKTQNQTVTGMYLFKYNM